MLQNAPGCKGTVTELMVSLVSWLCSWTRLANEAAIAFQAASTATYQGQIPTGLQDRNAWIQSMQETMTCAQSLGNKKCMTGEMRVQWKLH